jgi:kynurenine formamidase
MYDLTQPLTADTPRFPGDPAIQIEPVAGIAPWHVSALRLSTHSGTHMDAPRHCIPDGVGIGHFGPDRLIGRGLVLDASGLADNEAIPAAVIDQLGGQTWPGWFAVVRTGWDRYWRDERYFRHPFLSPALANALMESGAGLVAIDALNVDSTVDGSSGAHLVLLGANVLIAENLCRLDVLEPARTYVFACLPLSLGDADGAPARVVAWDETALP